MRGGIKRSWMPCRGIRMIDAGDSPVGRREPLAERPDVGAAEKPALPGVGPTVASPPFDAAVVCRCAPSRAFALKQMPAGGFLWVAVIGRRALAGPRTRPCATRGLRLGWIGSAGGSGGGETGYLLLDLGGLGVGAAQRDRLDRQVAPLDEPFVVLFGEQRAGEADHRLVVGEDPDDVGAAADLLVDTLQRVGGPQLGLVLGREVVERDQVFLGVLEQLTYLRCDPAARRSSTW